MDVLSDISHEKMWIWLTKGNLERETESLQIAAQNNAIRTNHIKKRIDKTQQNRLCGDIDKTISHIISECRKLAQKEYKTRHDWVGKVIYWELCKKLKFNHMNKWYMHIPDSALKNETHKLLCDFMLEMDHLLSTRRPDLKIINKKERNCRIVDFIVPADHRVKSKESVKERQIPGPCQRIEILWNMKVTIVTVPLKYYFPDGSLFFARVKSGQSGT